MPHCRLVYDGKLALSASQLHNIFPYLPCKKPAVTGDTVHRPAPCAKLSWFKQRRKSGCCRRSCGNVHQAQRLQIFSPHTGIGVYAPVSTRSA
jgi:hypothetical protein